MNENKDIAGWMCDQELEILAQWAGKVPLKGNIIEIGSMFGRSTFEFASAADPSVNIYCGDRFPDVYFYLHNSRDPVCPKSGKIYNMLEEFRKNTQKFNNITIMQGEMPVESTYSGDPIDLFF